MQPEKVDEMLANYREYAARVAYLSEAVKQTERLCVSLRQNVVEDSISITQVISDMPRGTAISDPTGRLGSMLAEGYVPEHILQAEADLESMKLEIRSKENVVVFVEAWLRGLSDRERFVIEHKVIAGMYWREMIPLYKREFGDEYSKQGLKRIKAKALEKIYRIAQ